MQSKRQMLVGGLVLHLVVGPILVSQIVILHFGKIGIKIKLRINIWTNIQLKHKLKPKPISKYFKFKLSFFL